MKKNQQKKTLHLLFRRLCKKLWRYFTPKNTTFFMALYLPEQKENKTKPSNIWYNMLYSPDHQTIIKRSSENQSFPQVFHKLTPVNHQL